MDHQIQYNLPEIDNRSTEILNAIVYNYINKLEPVSSRKLSKKDSFNLSPATIRNIMADLEELGFLVQPHTSAGRVPTDKAYRFFVEELLSQNVKLSSLEQQLIRDQLAVDFMSEEEIIREIPKVINRLSSYIGIAISPGLKTLIVKKIQFVSVNLTQVMAIIISETGQIYQRLLSLKEEINQDELTKISNFVNDSFHSLSLHEIKEKITSMMKEESNIYNALLNRALSFSQKAFDDINYEDLNSNFHLEGAVAIFNLPELANIEKMKKIFEAMIEKRHLVMLLNEFMKEDRVNICIGSESRDRNLEDLSFIISPYKKGDQTIGGLAVVGPTRMPYERMIGLIDYLSKLVSKLLTTKEENTFD